MPLRRPLARPKASRSGIRNHCQIDRRNRSAKPGIGHVAGRARLIPVGRNVFVKEHKLAERFYRFGPGILKDWRLTCPNRRRQGVPSRECPAFDDIHLAQNPG